LSESYGKHCYHYCKNKMFGRKNANGDLRPQTFEPSVALVIIIYAYDNTARIYRSIKWEKAAKE
jgi:hypothetical protein